MSNSSIIPQKWPQITVMLNLKDFLPVASGIARFAHRIFVVAKSFINSAPALVIFDKEVKWVKGRLVNKSIFKSELNGDNMYSIGGIDQLVDWWDETTTGIQSRPDASNESSFTKTFSTILGVEEILCSFRLVLEDKTSKEIPKSSRLEFLERFLAYQMQETILVYRKTTPRGHWIEKV